jgi:hypothetical protein
MKEIPVTRGQVALVDDCDYPGLSVHRWHIFTSAKGNHYARRCIRIDDRRAYVSMHREILGLPFGDRTQLVRHINGNGLDNQRQNLQIADQSQVLAADRTPRIGLSGFRGVTRDGTRWRASLGFRRQRIYLGLFGSERDAALCYDSHARRLLGSFARPNFPEVTQYDLPVRRRRKTLYRGVQRLKGRRLWTARIETEGIRSILGYFKTAREAARVYDVAAIRLHGDRAKLNFEYTQQ